MKHNLHKRRSERTRARINGTAVRPRASVFRSLTKISVQLIDDTAGRTLLAVNGTAGSNNLAKASVVGKTVGKKAVELGIESIVFDRGGYRYHGRVKAVADGMRESGLIF